MPEKFIVIFIIQGKEFPIEVNSKQQIKVGAHKALNTAGQQGSLAGWEVRNEAGVLLKMDASFEAQNICDSIKLFLSKGAGRGGGNLYS